MCRLKDINIFYQGQKPQRKEAGSVFQHPDTYLQDEGFTNFLEFI